MWEKYCVLEQIMGIVKGLHQCSSTLTPANTSKWNLVEHGQQEYPETGWRHVEEFQAMRSFGRVITVGWTARDQSGLFWLCDHHCCCYHMWWRPLESKTCLVTLHFIFWINVNMCSHKGDRNDEGKQCTGKAKEIPAFSYCNKKQRMLFFWWVLQEFHLLISPTIKIGFQCWRDVKQTTQQSCRGNCRWRLFSIALLVLHLTIHWKTLD